MKTLIVSIALIAQILSYKEVCECPEGKYFDPNFWFCDKNPSYQSPMYVRGCSKYVENLSNEVLCVQCEQGYFYQKKAPGIPTKCLKTKIKNCEKIAEVDDKSSKLQLLTMRFTQLLSLGYPFEFKCDQCELGRYWNGRICARNPGIGEDGFVKFCDTYNYDINSGKIRCSECSYGFYMEGNQCKFNPNDQPGCEIFKYNSETKDAECVQCQQQNYIVDQYGDCVSPYQFVPQCVKGRYHVSNNKASFTCSECESYHYVSKNGQSCISYPSSKGDKGYIQNCVKYNLVFGKITCTQCKSSCYLDTVKHICYEIISNYHNTNKQVDNCLYYDGKDEGFNVVYSCKQCKSGYQHKQTPIQSCRKCPSS